MEVTSTFRSCFDLDAFFYIIIDLNFDQTTPNN